MLKYLYVVVLLVPITLKGQALEIGKAVPDFTLHDIKYYTSETLTSADLKGKWIILDFFSKGCSACFQSLPKTNELQQKFKGQLDIILVGNKTGDDLSDIFEKFRLKQNLNLAVAYERDLLVKWGINSFPFLIWIDGSGVVKAITSSPALTEENIHLFLSGREFSHLSLRSSQPVSFDYTKPLLVNGNGGNETDFLFRSVLTKWTPAVKQVSLEHIDVLTRVTSTRQSSGMFQVTGENLETLYEFAYTGSPIDVQINYGKIYHLPVLLLKDSAAFGFDYGTSRNIYNYSVIVPKEKANRAFLMEVMQRDLKNYFGYDAALESHLVPYWSVCIAEGFKSRLKSKGGTEFVQGSAAGYKFRNVSIGKVIRVISGYYQEIPPLIDDSGADFNIDLEIDALMTDFEDLRRAMEKQGILMTRQKKTMPAIVIREPVPSVQAPGQLPDLDHD